MDPFFFLHPDGDCKFSRVQKVSKLTGLMQDAYDTNKDDLSRQGSLTSVSSVNPDQGMTIIDGGFPLENDSQTKKLSNALRKKGWKLSYERRKWHFKEWKVN